jgi:hypothetical protein
VNRRPALLPLLFLAAALALFLLSAWLVISLPYRYATTNKEGAH